MSLSIPDIQLKELESPEMDVVSLLLLPLICSFLLA